ncbi:unnamed protein product, partial [Discosporangium mesarthrocarpum]
MRGAGGGGLPLGSAEEEARRSPFMHFGSQLVFLSRRSACVQCHQEGMGAHHHPRQHLQHKQVPTANGSSRGGGGGLSGSSGTRAAGVGPSIWGEGVVAWDDVSGGPWAAMADPVCNHHPSRGKTYYTPHDASEGGRGTTSGHFESAWKRLSLFNITHRMHNYEAGVKERMEQPQCWGGEDNPG